MKILVPLNFREHLSDFVEAGAEEFYLGFYDDAWEKKYGSYADLNRLSGYKKNANRYDFKEALSIIQETNAKYADKVSLYVTFNAAVYSKEQLEDVANYIIELKKAGVDGVIVSNLELVMLCKELDMPSVVSTIAGVYNTSAVRVYQDCGAKRIILPRDLSTDEISAIIQKTPEVEYEVFLMRNGCTYSDSNCLGMHRLELCSVCAWLARAETRIRNRQKDETAAWENHEIYCNEFHNNTCGLCAIYRLIKSGAAAGKIVGRSECWEYLRDDILRVAKNRRIALSCNSEEEYLTKMERDCDREACGEGLSCYYPEVRFN